MRLDNAKAAIGRRLEIIKDWPGPSAEKELEAQTGKAVAEEVDGESNPIAKLVWPVSRWI